MSPDTKTRLGRFVQELTPRLSFPENPSRRAALAELIALSLIACSYSRSGTTETALTPPNSSTLDRQHFLTLPFAQTNYQISQGWLYNQTELKITGMQPEDHWGVDLALPPQTRILAPTDGIITASYQTIWMRGANHEIRRYNNDPKGDLLKWGLGFFVQIYNPERDIYVQLGHLSEVNSQLTFNKPYQNGLNEWSPNPTDLIISTQKGGTRINRGQEIGVVGFSGLARGDQEEYQIGLRKVAKTINTWDPAGEHVHMEVYSRDPNSYKIPTSRRDPFDIKNTADYYPGGKNFTNLGPNHLFILSEDGLPVFAA